MELVGKALLFVKVNYTQLKTPCLLPWYIQRVPGVKVSTSGFYSRADAESETSYTHWSNSQRFRSYEFLKYSK